jgi:O-antigen ligase
MPKTLISRNSFLGLTLGFFSFLITIAFLPSYTLDPITPPKLILICFLAFLFSISLLGRGFKRVNSRIEAGESLMLSFSFFLTLALILNRENFSERLLGVFGRSTGYVSYFSLSLIVLAIIRYRKKFDLRLIFVFILLSIIVVKGYFLIQVNGRDPFTYTEIYDVPSSTLGNPNFISGFLGFACIAYLLPFLSARRLITRLPALAFGLSGICLSLYVINKTNSIQGYFAFAAAILTSLTMYLIGKYLTATSRLLKRVIQTTLVSLGFLLLLFSYIAIPRLLLDQSIQVRFDYWVAGLKMIADNPLSGVGLDAFGDYYRQYRTQVAFDRLDEGFQVSDSAHNAVIDIGASGGLFLMTSYIGLQLYVLYLLFHRLKQVPTPDASLILSVGIWMGYHIQSFVTVTQIGVAIWGWIFTGLLIAQCQGVLNFDSMPIKPSKFRLPWSLKRDLVVSLGLLIVSLTLLIASWIHLRQEAAFYTAARQTDGLKLKAITLTWPHSTHRTILTTEAFSNGGYENFALEIASYGVAVNPRSYLLWKHIYSNPESSKEQRAEAYKALLIIEPRIDPARE